MAEVLAEYSDITIATDIFDYGYGQIADFLAPDLHPALTADWIASNPPFKERTEQFFQRAMSAPASVLRCSSVCSGSKPTAATNASTPRRRRP
jgi:hypothetical protein